MKNFIINSFVFGLVFSGTLLISWSLFLEDALVPYLAHIEVDADDFESNLEFAVAEAEEAGQEEFDFDVVENLGIMGLLPYLDAEVSPIGEIIIPSIDLSLPIFFGVTEAHVSLGAATMHPTQEMGEGNYALASHNMNVPGVLFTDVEHIEIGDQMVLRDANYLYIYETTIANNVIDPYQSYVIDDVPGEVLITLITCNEDGSLRVMVQGELVEKVAIEDILAEQSEELEQFVEILEIIEVDFPWLRVIGAVSLAGGLGIGAVLIKRR